jgi:RNase adapter protein RapZ
MNSHVVIITGLSGSGKSTAARTLEDADYFCVDNIPVDLLPKLIELSAHGSENLKRLALVMDLRQRDFVPRYSSVLQAFESSSIPVQILFLEARDEVLVRRYSETRRQHPLASLGSVMEGVRKERNELRAVREKADWIIDTSDMTVHQLKQEIKKKFLGKAEDDVRVTVVSFGFGRGVPLESDLALDVRFLPNPYFVTGLKEQTGVDHDVKEWLASHETTRLFLEKLDDLLLFLLPLYIREGKRYLTISVGCTGGRHRSVVVAEHLQALLVREGYGNVELRHRELAAS